MRGDFCIHDLIYLFILVSGAGAAATTTIIRETWRRVRALRPRAHAKKDS